MSRKTAMATNIDFDRSLPRFQMIEKRFKIATLKKTLVTYLKLKCEKSTWKMYYDRFCRLEYTSIKYTIDMVLYANLFI